MRRKKSYYFWSSTILLYFMEKAWQRKTPWGFLLVSKRNEIDLAELRHCSSRCLTPQCQNAQSVMITTIICLSCPPFSITAAARMLNVNTSFPTKDKTQDLWDVTLCNLVDIYQYHLRGTSCSFQTLTSIYKTIWCHTSEDWLLWKPQASIQAKSNWIAISCIFCSL